MNVCGTLSRLHVPEDSHSHQGDGNDPQNDVFTATLFFCHAKQYTTPEIADQVPLLIPGTSTSA
jgi:hypothetical protein